MTTLILAPVFNEYSEAVRRAAHRSGWRVVPVQGWEMPGGLEAGELA